MPDRQCFLCGNQFQLGPQAYLGMQVKAWDIEVCNDCPAAQRGGIVLALYPQVAEHLNDDHGWIRWPLEQHAAP